MNKLVLSSALILSAFASNQAFAGTANESFQANANIERECVISTTQAGNDPFVINAFSSTEQVNGGITGATAVSVRCTLHSTAAEGASHVISVRYSEGLHADVGSTCDAPLRRMKSADGDYISYMLAPGVFKKSFGCGTKYSLTPASAPDGFVDQAVQKLDFNQYGNLLAPLYSRQATTRVAPGQDLSIGTYTDTITVTVEF